MHQSTKKFGRIKLVAALFAGILANFGFPNPGVFASTIVALVVLFYCWESATPKRSALLGFVFGVGLYSIGLSWLYISIHDFGRAPSFFAVFVLLLLVCFLSLFIALIGYVQARVRTSAFLRFLLLIPSLWVIAEWCRSWIFTGFPWLYFGYSQVESWLVGWAPLMGVLGVSFATCAIAGALVFTILKGIRIKILLFALILISVGIFGKSVEWATPNSKPISAALIQGDISLRDKWNVNLIRRHLHFYITQSSELAHNDLIIWPEAALPYTADRLEKLKVWDTLQNHPSDFLVGALEIQQRADEEVVFNSAYAISSEIQIYRKHRLVPFGEFIPFRSLLQRVFQYVDVAANDLSPYQEPQQALQLAGQPAGVSICYEDVFPAEILKLLPEATFLINISEDAWFGEFFAPNQRLQMSRMRSIETARPMLRVANKGISASIDHKGNVIKQLTQAQGKVLQTKIYPTTGSTPFVWTGNIPILILCFLLSLLILTKGFVHTKFIKPTLKQQIRG